MAELPLRKQYEISVIKSSARVTVRINESRKGEMDVIERFVKRIVPGPSGVGRKRLPATFDII